MYIDRKIISCSLQADTRTGKPRVWLCRDKITGQPRGDGIVGYEHAHIATAAIDRFHSKPILLNSLQK
jgi:RNA-binding protein FUS